VTEKEEAGDGRTVSNGGGNDPEGGSAIATTALAYDIDTLTKVYRRGNVLANDGITLQVSAGEIIGVFGPNGAGKTTLVRQMMGLLRPSSGTIRLLGRDIISDPRIVPDLVAYFSQRIAYLGNFTFGEVLLHAGVLRGVPLTEAKLMAAELIQRFECEQFSKRYLFTLSGGERRLALLLSAFMSRCPVLLLDEPTNELDPRRRQLVWQYLLAANRQEGKTVVLVTHNVAEAESIVDRVLVIDRGRVQALGTPGELKSRLGALARVSVSLKPGVLPLGPLAKAQHAHGQTWYLLVEEQRVTDVMSEVLHAVGLEGIDRFQLTSCSLEDVYAALTGRELDAPRDA
jgi:ABC-type multidrug transport system ATPase subunit